MPVERALIQEIVPHLRRYGCRISAAGISVGSMLYLGFGPPRKVETLSGTTRNDFPAILELGADEWHVVEMSGQILSSDFADIELARQTLADALVGRLVIDIDLSIEKSTLLLDRGGSIISLLSDDQASGFLYYFRADDGPCWDTMDGLTPIVPQ